MGSAVWYQISNKYLMPPLLVFIVFSQEKSVRWKFIRLWRKSVLPLETFFNHTPYYNYACCDLVTYNPLKRGFATCSNTYKYHNKGLFLCRLPLWRNNSWQQQRESQQQQHKMKLIFPLHWRCPSYFRKSVFFTT